MPSNQCTNTLMELSFAVGNMFGAAECVKDDYRQLGDILEAWECSKRGKVEDELALMKEIVGKAVALGGTRRQAIPVTFCQDLWYAHNRLVNTMNIFDEEGLGLGQRGPVPPVVKGPDGVAIKRSLDDIRAAGWPSQAPVVVVEGAEPLEGETAARYGSSGKKEKRWYPQRLAR
jgi:hypothetical protein